MSVVIGLLFVLAILMLAAGLRRVRTPGLELEVAIFGNAAGRERRTAYQRWVQPLALRFANSFGLLRALSEREQVERQLEYAGRPGGLTPHEFYGVQLYGAFAGLVSGLLMVTFRLPLAPLLLIALPIAGFYVPRLWLRSRIRRRQHAVSVALPDLLDMLAVCVTAGMGFDVALGLLTDRGEGPLYEELDRLLRELRIGTPREQAFRNLAQRNSSEVLRSFVDALLQANELGAPIAATLQRQAEDIRIGRRQRARELGAKAATKVSLVVVLLVMPSVMCLILGSLVMAFRNGLGAFPTP